MPQPIGTPTLCRLCRRPIPRAAKTCPACGARQSWTGRPRNAEARSRWRAWRIALGAGLVVVLAVGALVWLGVLSQIKAGVSSNDAPFSRPSAKECAELAGELANRPGGDQRVPQDLRDRIRQCFERR